MLMATSILSHMSMLLNLRLWLATWLALVTRKSANVTTEVLEDLKLEVSSSPTALSEETQASSLGEKS